MLTPPMQKFVLHWGEMGTRWGMNRSVAQIHALLYLAEEPVSADVIARTLGIARSNVSNSLKELQNWDLVGIDNKLGDRRDHFVAKTDIWEMLSTIAEARKRREIDPTVALLKECVRDLACDKATPKGSRQRIEEMLAFTSELTGWFEQMQSLPSKTVLKLMRMGARVGKLISA